MKKYLWLVYPLFTFAFIISSIHKVNVARERLVEKIDKEYVKKEKPLNEAKNYEFDSSLEIPRIDLEPQDKIEKPAIKQIGIVETTENLETTKVEEPVYEKVSNSYSTRMTSFYANDGYGTGECTGSGKCTWDFQVNEHGWYTYQGKLVIATATTYLANKGWHVVSGVHLYKYYEEVTLTIGGVDYQAIILDSCGSSMKNDRVDLFVSNVNSVKDTMIEVRRNF